MTKDENKPVLNIAFDPGVERDWATIWTKVHEEFLIWGTCRRDELKKYQKEIAEFIQKHKDGIKMTLRPPHRGNGKSKLPVFQTKLASIKQLNAIAGKSLGQSIIFDEYDWNALLKVKPIVKAVTDHVVDIDRNSDDDRV